MNKAELIEEIAKKAQLTRTQSETVLDAAIHIIQDKVASGKEVKIVGFGTFDQSARRARNGRNPKTGSSILIPASLVPRFRPGKDFRVKVDPTVVK
jgi:DNA-binding protein HU-beta